VIPTSLTNAFLQRLFPHSPLPIGNSFELDVSAALAYHVDAARVEPAR
jgi:hypothetical protein